MLRELPRPIKLLLQHSDNYYTEILESSGGTELDFRKWVFALCGTVMLVALIGITGPSSGVAQTQEPDATERTAGGIVGASVVHPEQWFVKRERSEYDDTFGFVIWKPRPGTMEDHGGMPAVRVARAHELEPGQIGKAVREKLRAYPDLPLKRQKVRVGRSGIRGTAVGPIPGSTPSVEIYVPFKNRVYQINVYGKSLDAQDRKLLSSLRFYKPSRSIDSLQLPDAAREPEGSQATDTRQEESSSVSSSDDSMTFSGMATRGEKRIKEGCWRANRRFFVQTQHDSNANGRKGDGVRKGWTVAGRPNFWGQYTHGNIGQGRCTGRSNTNDKFAVDYPLNKGDLIYSPFKRGKVMFAGRNYTHNNYGKFVVIKASNGKYVNISAHLNSIPSSIRKGKVVYKNTVIGRAGNTGGDIAVGEVHLHTAFYRYPKYNPDGSPYGGAGLKIDRPRYSGTAARKLRIGTPRKIYRLGKVKPNYKRYCRESTICGEGYKLSN